MSWAVRALMVSIVKGGSGERRQKEGAVGELGREGEQLSPHLAAL